MKIHVSELEGAALSYAVAMAQGYKPTFGLWCGEMVACEIETIGDFGDQVTLFYEYHDRWDQCGPLINDYGIYSEPCRNLDNPRLWIASCMQPKGSRSYAYGDGPLEAICRAIVIWHIGEEVEIPDELVK